jgi:hypothetical protein
VNPAGEPERDESGLPPVDIKVPDDARELDRDVQAYYRELRAERRQQRGLRLRGSLAKDGIILPLLACCLILALITGTLLTVFTATSDQNLGLPGNGKAAAQPRGPGRAPAGGATSSAPPASATPPPTPAIPNTVPGALPSGTTIAIFGQPVPIQHLSRAALVLVPSHCNCASTVEWLLYVARGAHARAYLVYTTGTASDVQRLYANLSSGYRAEAALAFEPDSANALRESIPPTLHEDGLAVILIGPTKHTWYATSLRPQDNPTSLIHALTH